MRDINIIKRLRLISYLDISLLLIAGFVIKSYSSYIIGFLIIAISIFIQWKYYRCPHCKNSLDFRLKLNVDTHCPSCGHIISQKNLH